MRKESASFTEEEGKEGNTCRNEMKSKEEKQNIAKMCKDQKGEKGKIILKLSSEFR